MTQTKGLSSRKSVKVFRYYKDTDRGSNRGDGNLNPFQAQTESKNSLSKIFSSPAVAKEANVVPASKLQDDKYVLFFNIDKHTLYKTINAREFLLKNYFRRSSYPLRVGKLELGLARSNNIN